jgi:hypothetical protein
VRRLLRVSTWANGIGIVLERFDLPTALLARRDAIAEMRVERTEGWLLMIEELFGMRSRPSLFARPEVSPKRRQLFFGATCDNSNPRTPHRVSHEPY